MTKPVIGIIGGSGLYQIDGLADVAWRRIASPFGETSDEFCFGTLGRAAGRVPAPPRARPRAAAVGDQFPRQYRCAEALRRHRHRLACRRSAACARIWRPAISSWSTSSSTAPLRATKSFFGTGCVAHVSMAHPVCGRVGDALAAAGGRSRHGDQARRHLSGHGGAAILDPGRERALSVAGTAM